jgi:DNA-binding protein HU-beta
MLRPLSREAELMIKADIVNRVAESCEVPRIKAAEAVDTILDAIKDALTAGKRIELRGFGVFQVRNRKRGVGRNPKTGVEVAISPGKTVRFKPGKELKAL